MWEYNQPTTFNTPRCSFCSQRQDQTTRLVTGAGGVNICQECINLSQKMIIAGRADFQQIKQALFSRGQEIGRQELTSIEEERKREQLVAALKEQGTCITCYDLATGEIFGQQGLIYENKVYKIALELYSRTPGHTRVVYKPHCEDLSQLSEETAGPLFQVCIHVSRALKKALGVETVGFCTQYDGPINPLSFHLLPHYADETFDFAPSFQGHTIGETAQKVRHALEATKQSASHHNTSRAP